jgi:tetratricopeptide (TPR) repeat protein
MVNTGAVRWNLATALKESGKHQLAQRQLDIAIEQFGAELEREPRSASAHLQLAKIMAALEQYDQAGKHFLQAVNINPLDVELHIELVKNLEAQGKRQKAIDHLNAAILFISKNSKEPDTAKLKQYLQTLTSKKSRDNGTQL